MWTRFWRVQTACIALTIACLPGSAHAQPQFVGFDTFPCCGANPVTALNDDGTVAVGIFASSAARSNVPSPFNLLTTDRSTANDVSANGAVVVGSRGIASPTNAYRWTQSGGFVNLIQPQQSIERSEATAVSSNGNVIVGLYRMSQLSPDAGAYHSVRWVAANAWFPESLGALPTTGLTDTRAVACDSSGSVIVGLSNSHGFRWLAEGPDGGPLMAPLPPLSGFDRSDPKAVSGDGRHIVGTCRRSLPSLTYRATRWFGEVGQDLGLPPGCSRSYATAMSENALLVGGSATLTSAGTGPSSVATIWTSTLGMVNLNTYLPSLGVNLGTWKLASITAISADGRTI